MSTAHDDEKPELASDEDWKQRIKAEDAALDEKFKTEASTTGAGTAESKPGNKPAASSANSEPAELPPASLFSLASMLSMQAMVALGVIANPATGEAETNLPLARHFIDSLGVLEEKTKGNLELNEQNFLTSTLCQLRIAFVELSKNQSTEKK